MSNPYAPKSQQKTEAAGVVEAPELKFEKELTVEDVPTGSIEDVLKWVDEDPKKAALAIEAEEANKARVSLLKTLKGM